MEYLIMKCEELGDQWECDAERTPIAIMSDWRNWVKKNNPNYRFEIYSWDGNSMKCIKEYEDALEEGMAFYWWDNETENCETELPHIINKWPNHNKNSIIPSQVMKFKKYFNEDYKNDLRQGGSFSFVKDNKYYVYGYYEDSYYDCGY